MITLCLLKLPRWDGLCEGRGDDAFSEFLPAWGRRHMLLTSTSCSSLACSSYFLGSSISCVLAEDGHRNQRLHLAACPKNCSLSQAQHPGLLWWGPFSCSPHLQESRESCEVDDVLEAEWFLVHTAQREIATCFGEPGAHVECLRLQGGEQKVQLDLRGKRELIRSLGD